MAKAKPKLNVDGQREPSAIVPQALLLDKGEPVYAVRLVRGLRELSRYFGVSLRTAEKWSQSGLLDDARDGNVFCLNRVAVALLRTDHYDRKRVEPTDPIYRKFEAALCYTLRSLIPALANASDEAEVTGLIEGAIEAIFDTVDGLRPAPPESTEKWSKTLMEVATHLRTNFRSILELNIEDPRSGQRGETSNGNGEDELD